MYNLLHEDRAFPADLQKIVLLRQNLDCKESSIEDGPAQMMKHRMPLEEELGVMKLEVHETLMVQRTPVMKMKCGNLHQGFSLEEEEASNK
ncbi:hypothetical protein QYF36_008620 [Acer negundo]|nr:hypothetical protein QYF36_008620 [Acer negundo]